jgi:hypothetical protein
VYDDAAATTHASTTPAPTPFPATDHEEKAKALKKEMTLVDRAIETKKCGDRHVHRKGKGSLGSSPHCY